MKLKMKMKMMINMKMTKAIQIMMIRNTDEKRDNYDDNDNVENNYEDRKGGNFLKKGDIKINN